MVMSSGEEDGDEWLRCAAVYGGRDTPALDRLRVSSVAKMSSRSSRALAKLWSTAPDAVWPGEQRRPGGATGWRSSGSRSMGYSVPSR